MKTIVRINKTFNNSSNLKGIASVNFDGRFAVTGIRIIDSQNGLFVAMPTRKVGNEYKDICFPLSKEYREELNNAVLDVYHQKLEETQDYETKNIQKQQIGATDSEQESDAGADHQEEQDALSEDFEESESQGMNMRM